MVAVAYVSPAPIRRLAVVRTRPVAGPARTTLPVTVYRRRRVVAVLMLVSVVAALALALQGLSASFGDGPLADSRQATPTGTYVVQPGDTFWSIAGRLRPDEDPRPLVARMVAAHGSPVLIAGERLAMPAAA